MLFKINEVIVDTEWNMNIVSLLFYILDLKGMYII